MLVLVSITARRTYCPTPSLCGEQMKWVTSPTPLYCYQQTRPVPSRPPPRGPLKHPHKHPLSLAAFCFTQTLAGVDFGPVQQELDDPAAAAAAHRNTSPSLFGVVMLKNDWPSKRLHDEHGLFHFIPHLNHFAASIHSFFLSIESACPKLDAAGSGLVPVGLFCLRT